MSRLHNVYSTINDTPPVTNLIICCIIFLLIVGFCIRMYLRSGRNSKVKLNAGIQVNPYLAVLIPVTVFFTIFLGLDMMGINIYFEDKAIVNSNQLKFVQGRVADFHPMPDNGHGNEYFYVNGVGFAYSKFEEGIGGYHKTKGEGGAIKANLYVKIGYYATDFRNIILKLDTE